tara:strand:+ start:233 stop:946 length:714 start_codon:yes stop_codon:yes gene_type:complete
MATTTATVTLSSTDLLSSVLNFSTTSVLSIAGHATGLSLTSGLGKTNFTIAAPGSRSKVIYRADDAATDKANKVYLKNLSATASEFFTVYIDQEEMGRLYAGDWAFFPWSATQGTRETFVVTIADTWAAADTWDFDGITTTATSATVALVAGQIDAQHYPNWTTSITGAAVTFTARHAGVNGVVTSSTAISGDTLATASDGSAAITSAAVGTRSEADIVVESSVVTTMDLEHILINE